MKVDYTPAYLIAFEDEIAALFADKRIAAPVHLAGGNEEKLIRIFQEHVNPDDWVLGGWRMHYHALLKGVPPEQLRQAVLDGKSISLCFPEYRILSSGIVGGVAPIAVGLALGIKRKEAPRKVICFLGDMSAESGIVHESIKYAAGFDLPVLWVIEDNEVSVSTSTIKVWGYKRPHKDFAPEFLLSGKILRYHYHLSRPHVGIGKHVAF